MRLTKKNITHYLLDKGFLKGETLIKGDYILTQSMSRNCIFRIQHETFNGLFVKQLLNQDSTNSYLMQKDATSHYLMHESGVFNETITHIPKYYGYDPQHHILVTEYFANTKNVHELIYQEKKLSTVYAQKMAEILATFHFDITQEVEKNASLQFFNKQLPWILNMRTLQNSDPNNINNSVIAEIHKHVGLVEKIEKLAEKWNPYSLIHGDIKWMNFIVLEGGNELKLVDWEIADLGDPLWDVAGVFQSYFCSWILSYDNQNLQNHQQINGHEFLSLEKILTVVQLFWNTYSDKQKFTSEEKHEKLMITLSYMSVRMIQTAFENNMSQVQLYPNSVRIIQFCDHLLSDTESLAKQWKLTT